ncbi:hypothetical protein ACFLSI_05310 [Bacteroidota bacterium]
MKRRKFIQSIGLGAGVLSIPGINVFKVAAGVNSNEKKKFKYYTWFSDNGKLSGKEYKEMFNLLKKNGIDGVLIEGNWNKWVPYAKKAGLETHAWIWALNCPDKKVMKDHREWYSISRNGDSCVDKPPYVDYYRWLCPTKPEVLEYLKNKFRSLCDIEGLDYIHLDYIRHPDVILPIGLWEKYDLVQDKEYPEFDFCYCDDCRKKFKELHGVDPMKLPDPSKNQAWLNYRYDGVTEVVNSISDFVHSFGKKVSAAVFPYPELAKKLVRQDWSKWKLDKVFPMIYHSFYNEDIKWVGSSTKAGVNSIPENRDLITGLYIPEMSPDELRQAITEAKNNGAKGISIFSKPGITAKHWKEIRN